MTAKDRLNRIKTVIDGGGVYRDYTDSTQTFNADISEVLKALTELEELKKRDTPMKLTQSSRFTTDKKLYGMYACNNCHNVVPYLNINNKYVKPNFCYRCGQRLDWEELK